MKARQTAGRGAVMASPAIRIVVLTLAALLGTASPVAAASASPGPSASPSTPPQSVPVPIDTGAIVGLTASGVQDGHAWLAEGWGVVVDPSGLILANASVVAPDSPGVAAGYGDPALPATVSNIQIWTAAAGQPMAATYTGKVLAVDGYLDLAIVAPDSTIGDTVTQVAAGSVNLPAVALASTAPAAGSPIIALAISDGPATAVLSIAAFAATVTAVNRPQPGRCCPQIVSDLGLPRAWPGGDLLVDATGALVAYPAYLLGYVPRLANGTPADAIAPLLAAARAGTAYTSTYGTPGSGDESLTFRTWSTSQTPCASGTGGRVSTYPTNTSRIVAAFDGSRFTQNEDVLQVWVQPDTQQLLATFSGPWAEKSGRGCVSYGIAGNGGALANGRYQLNVFAGGTLRQVASTTVKVGVAAGSIVLTGRVVDADTGQPIADALVAVLKPGIDLRAWYSSPSSADLATVATSGDDGTFATDPPIAQGSYPFLVLADGYQPVGGTIRTGTNGILGDVGLAPLP